MLDTYCRKREFMGGIRESIETAFELLKDCYRDGHKLLICGNGVSCSDADHITGELMKGFLLKRPLTDGVPFRKFGKDGEYLFQHLQGGLAAVNLGAHTSLITAMINDIDGDLAFAQQVNALGVSGDVLLGISTSGKAKDVLYAGLMAKIRGMKLVGLTGQQGGKLESLADCLIRVPSMHTPDIQDMHTSIYHAVCAMVENEFWDI